MFVPSVRHLWGGVSGLTRAVNARNCSTSVLGKTADGSAQCSDQLCADTGLDPRQARLLDEMCLLVDENDRQIGTASKRHCHQWTENRATSGGGSCPLHRAFSVFLFNSRDELLLQQRSHDKITFPGHYTNTCCSHPLAVADEQITTNGLGVINAARRRLQQELGIPPEQVPVSQFLYLTRILYSCRSAPATRCDTTSSTAAVWGEHEIDYILVVRGVDADPRPDPGEVLHWQYVSRHALHGLLDKLRVDDVPLTPWFSRLLADHRLLLSWWRNLHQLQPFVDHHTIHRL